MGVISFARGVPAPECLPVEELADCARAAIERDGPAVLSYGPGGGYGPLREWLAARHGVEPARVVITSGSLQGFVFLAEQLVQPGARVLVEAPTYDRPLKILERLGAEIVGLPMDDDGLRVDALERRCRRARSPRSSTRSRPSRTRAAERSRPSAARASSSSRASTSCSCSRTTPTGSCATRAIALPTMFELAGGENVAYASSFSKTVAPGVRVGYFVLPPELAAKIEALAVSTYISPPFLTQATVYEFLRRGNFEPNLERVNGLLGARRDAMLEALEREHARRRDAGAGPRAATSSGSTCRRPPASCSPRAEAAGVTFVPGTDFFADGSGTRSLRLAFSFVSPDEIADGVARLAGLLAARRRRRRRSSCESRIPPTKPMARPSRISQTSDTFAVAKTKCSVHRSSGSRARTRWRRRRAG